MKAYKYIIIQELGVISEGNKGWRRELNLISWNDGEPKYDIRGWAPNHEKMGKEISLRADELDALKNLLSV